MSPDDSHQHYSMEALEKNGHLDENAPGVLSSASSTAPVHQPPNSSKFSITSSTTARPSLRETFPRFFVLPHLLSKSAWILLIATSVVMIVYIWLYLGALWSPMSRVKNVEILLYNGDAGFDYTQTPPLVSQLFRSLTHNSSLGILVQKQIMDPAGPLNHIVSWVDVSAQSGWDRNSLIEEVEKGKYWGLLYLPSNFSNNMLTYAPELGRAPATVDTIKPIAMEYVFDQGRNYATHSIVERYISKAVDSLSKGVERNLLTSPANQTLLATMHPVLWIQAIHLSETVMNPVLVYGQNFATYVVFIVLYIGSMLGVFSICKYLPTTVETFGILTLPSEVKPTSKRLPKFPALRIVLARFTVALLFSLVHTIFIWMVPQVLHGHQMSEHYSAGYAFAFIWFVGISFSSIIFLLSQLLTVDGFQGPATMLMILMFTSSGGVLDWVMMPGFFRAGVAFPFTYGVKGLRAIYFGSRRDDMWLNWVVVLGWIVVPALITTALARSEIRERRQNMRRTASIQAEV